VRDEKLGLLGAVGVRAPQAKKTAMQITTAQEPFKKRADPGRESAVALAEALVPVAEELLVVLLDDLFELVGGAAGLIPRGV
jgi:hypothetical protein